VVFVRRVGSKYAVLKKTCPPLYRFVGCWSNLLCILTHPAVEVRLSAFEPKKVKFLVQAVDCQLGEDSNQFAARVSLFQSCLLSCFALCSRRLVLFRGKREILVVWCLHGKTRHDLCRLQVSTSCSHSVRQFAAPDTAEQLIRGVVYVSE
jgi:hypothetical protein